MSPIREMRLRPPLQVFYLILLTLPMKGLGAALTMQGDILYPAYALAPRVYGIGPMEDQRIGGLLMWLPSGSVLWGAAAIVFYRWWRREQDSEDAALLAPEAEVKASGARPG
jgi:putative membrane protein